MKNDNSLLVSLFRKKGHKLFLCPRYSVGGPTGVDQAPPNWKNIHRDTHKEGIEFLNHNFMGTISITISKLLHTPDLLF